MYVVFAIIRYSAWPSCLPKAHAFTKITLKALPSCYLLIPAIMCVGDVSNVVDHLETVNTVTGELLKTLDASSVTDKQHLDVLYNVHERLKVAITDTYMQIYNTMATNSTLEAKLNAKGVLTHPTLEHVHDRHNTIINKIIQLHMRGISTEGSYNSHNNIMSYANAFKTEFAKIKLDCEVRSHLMH